MRYALLLVLLVFVSTGCSMMIAETGTHHSEFETREKAHKLFGKPTAIDTLDGEPIEDFYTRRKFADGSESLSRLIWFFWTLGLSELYFTPVELVRLTRTTVTGQTIRLFYDKDGAVKMYDINPVSRIGQQTGDEAKKPSVQK